ncbi:MULTISPECIES: glycosyltransferase family 4 protein [unclassified Pseudomonas]|uniref:glycosyltransferase family 4 protein n=1 Tax=unclassified Pseudomonas TaxID=196821 RepID=UPI00111C1307|nr:MULTISPECIES: glycosyltransferase family 4 protein [unclassified Pseudomonas]
MKTVLLLSTYPIASPRHGGQVRVANIASTFEQSGWSVTHLAVYEPEGYPPSTLGPNDVKFPAGSDFRKYKGAYVPLINDLLSGEFAASEQGGFPEILKKLPPAIDVIHVEQPWLWPLVLKIKQMPQYRNACLIYGSQNIEAPLKQEILDSYGIKGAAPVIADIEALERKAALEADIAVAVTQADYDILKAWGAAMPLLAPNGIAPWTAKAEVLETWKARLPESPWILYVASAHPPNFKGFNECLGSSLACIPPDSKLVVVGSVCEHLEATLRDSRWGQLNLSRLQLLYMLPDEDLDAVKTLAHAFLLPIPHGGGSNIKTAEAIYSGKYVVGTESAFRGFEQHLSQPEISVARSPAEFHAAIRGRLTGPASTEGKGPDRASREPLTWARSLEPIPQAAAQVIEKKAQEA